MKSTNSVSTAMGMVVLAALLLAGIPAAHAEWEGLNGPEGGVVNGLFVGADGTVYALTPSSGVYVSTDAGGSWGGSAFTGGSQPVLAESPGGTLYLADNFSDDLYMSDDHLASLTPVSGPDAGNLESVYAVSDDILMTAGRFTGALEIYHTADGGGSWTSVFNAGFQGSGPMWAETNGGLLMAFKTIAPPQFSSDDGATWTEVTNPGSGLGASSLLGTADGNALMGRGTSVFRSTDGGSSWTEVLSDMTIVADKLTQAPDGTIYAGSSFNQYFSSSDDGQTWSEITTGLETSEQTYSLLALADKLLLGSWHGVWESADGTAWSLTNDGLIATKPRYVVAHADGRVAAGDHTVTGLHVMAPNGDWSLHPEKGPAVAITEDGDVYCSLNQTLWRSTDGMASWTETAGFPGDAPAYRVIDSPAGTLFALASFNSLYRSTDDGDSWTALDPVGVKDLAYGSDGTLYITTAFNGFQVSTDNGDSWTATDGAAPLETVDIAPDGTLYRRNLQVAQRSDDGGTTWTDIHTAAIPDTVQFPGFSINALGVDGDGVVYLDLDWYSNWPVQIRGGGVYTSSDAGVSWSHMDDWRANGFNMGQDGYFYAGTSRGVYRIMSGADVADGAAWELVDFALAQNYPNPFNPATTIHFSLPAPGHTELQVFDVTGRLVGTLLSGEMSAGHHAVEFSGADLASGVYFYRLAHPDGNQVRRMTLVK